ncbi:unnamed protein product [Cyprideis torosa]|uniref:Uncharacterized protein n=1 Tax=Cyprideis torosa TaxID=163714 RepID=A0A7R8ZHJ1_9CRUS|nr:unnamed protein product [Cyprideis torosa]CAG0883886.1 unnamed protein product [Cyprideis torosa]
MENFCQAMEGGTLATVLDEQTNNIMAQMIANHDTVFPGVREAAFGLTRASGSGYTWQNGAAIGSCHYKGNASGGIVFLSGECGVINATGVWLITDCQRNLALPFFCQIPSEAARKQATTVFHPGELYAQGNGVKSACGRSNMVPAIIMSEQSLGQFYKDLAAQAKWYEDHSTTVMWIGVDSLHDTSGRPGDKPRWVYDVGKVPPWIKNFSPTEADEKMELALWMTNGTVKGLVSVPVVSKFRYLCQNLLLFVHCFAGPPSPSEGAGWDWDGKSLLADTRVNYFCDQGTSAVTFTVFCDKNSGFWLMEKTHKEVSTQPCFKVEDLNLPEIGSRRHTRSNTTCYLTPNATNEVYLALDFRGNFAEARNLCASEGGIVAGFSDVPAIKLMKEAMNRFGIHTTWVRVQPTASDCPELAPVCFNARTETFHITQNVSENQTSVACELPAGYQPSIYKISNYSMSETEARRFGIRFSQRPFLVTERFRLMDLARTMEKANVTETWMNAAPFKYETVLDYVVDTSPSVDPYDNTTESSYGFRLPERLKEILRDANKFGYFPELIYTSRFDPNYKGDPSLFYPKWCASLKAQRDEPGGWTQQYFISQSTIFLHWAKQFYFHPTGPNGLPEYFPFYWETAATLNELGPNRPEYPIQETVIYNRSVDLLGLPGNFSLRKVQLVGFKMPDGSQTIEIRVKDRCLLLNVTVHPSLPSWSQLSCDGVQRIICVARDTDPTNPAMKQETANADDGIGVYYVVPTRNGTASLETFEKVRFSCGFVGHAAIVSNQVALDRMEADLLRYADVLGGLKAVEGLYWLKIPPAIALSRLLIIKGLEPAKAIHVDVSYYSPVVHDLVFAQQGDEPFFCYAHVEYTRLARRFLKHTPDLTPITHYSFTPWIWIGFNEEPIHRVDLDMFPLPEPKFSRRVKECPAIIWNRESQTFSAELRPCNSLLPALAMAPSFYKVRDCVTGSVELWNVIGRESTTKDGRACDNWIQSIPPKWAYLFIDNPSTKIAELRSECRMFPFLTEPSCLAQGEISPCQLKNCSDVCLENPVLPEGMFIEGNIHGKFLGDSIKYRCNNSEARFNHKALTVERTCLATGKWESMDGFQCLLSCQDDPELSNLNRSIQITWNGDRSMGAQVALTCPNGSMWDDLRNPQRRLSCTEDLEWETVPNNASCIPAICKGPPIVRDPMMMLDWQENLTYHINDTVRYSCSPGYSLDDGRKSRSLKCQQKDVTWEDISESCHISECLQDPTIAVPGLELHPSEDIICNGTYCSVGATVDMDCSDLFELTLIDGNVTSSAAAVQALCSVNGTWKPFIKLHNNSSIESNMEIAVKCLPICPGNPPSVPEHGNRTWTKSNQEGTEIVYSCKEGFHFHHSLQKELVVSCTEHQWKVTARNFSLINLKGDSEVSNDALQLECLPDICPMPQTGQDIPEQSVLSKPQNKSAEVNSAIEIRCGRGFRFEGGNSSDSVTLTCQSNFQWSPFPSNTSCIRVTCLTTDLPTNVKFVNNSVAEFEDRKEIVCQEGYGFQNESLKHFAVCNASGQWELVEDLHNDICIRTHCLADPPKVNNSKMSWNGSRTVGSEVSYVCEDGTILVSQCSASSGEWDVPNATCPLVLNARSEFNGDSTRIREDREDPTIIAMTMEGAEETKGVLPTSTKRPVSNNVTLDATKRIDTAAVRPLQERIPPSAAGEKATPSTDNSLNGTQSTNDSLHRTQNGAQSTSDSLHRTENGTQSTNESLHRTHNGAQSTSDSLHRTENGTQSTTESLNGTQSIGDSLNGTHPTNSSGTEGNKRLKETAEVRTDASHSLGGGDDRATSDSPVQSCEEDPAPLAGASVEVTEGGVARYSCDPHSWFPSLQSTTLEVTCNGSGWTPAADECRPFECPTPALRHVNAVRDAWEGDVAFGSKVTYSCGEGQVFRNTLSQSQTSQCRPDGTWTPLPPDSVCIVELRRPTEERRPPQGILLRIQLAQEHARKLKEEMLRKNNAGETKRTLPLGIIGLLLQRLYVYTCW